MALRATSSDPETLKEKQMPQQKRKIEKSPKHPQKMSFQLSVKICFLLGRGVQKFPSLTTWPKKCAPPKHFSIGLLASQFVKNRYASRNGHFWTKATKSRNSRDHLFLPFKGFFFSFNKKHKKAETPLFMVF